MIDRCIGAGFLARLFVATLLALGAGHTHRSLYVRQPDPAWPGRWRSSRWCRRPDGLGAGGSGKDCHPVRPAPTRLLPPWAPRARATPPHLLHCRPCRRRPRAHPARGCYPCARQTA
ncbi:hypothetical protein PF008_g18210 [Phytophthora fragariae]|uniref:Secreted protein n=1 Tax=Phytophthora fragariae TaxID=53985 RepID=A0A6G0R605_9STRA|nr:hypothetical protein PF008_g18210 [Phytophthora fragariae]